METARVLNDEQLNQLVYNALSFGTAVMLGAFVLIGTLTADATGAPATAAFVVVLTLPDQGPLPAMLTVARR